jgi:hypothetical protein
MSSVEKGHEIAIEHGVMSGEGLLERLADDPEQGRGGRRALIYVPELSVLMRKMKQGTGNTLGPILLQAADAEPVINMTTRARQMTATGSLVAMLAGSAPAWVEDDIGDVEIRGGWANRILWFCHAGGNKPDVSLPDQLGDQPLQELRALLRLRVHLGVMRHSVPMGMSPEAREAWGAWYSIVRKHVPLSDVIEAATARRAAHAIRLCVLYAALDVTNEIAVEHVEAATAVADYCAKSATYLFLTTSDDPDARLNRAVMRYMKRCAATANGAVSPRKIRTIHAAAAPRANMERFMRQLRSMAEGGYIRMERGMAWVQP